MTAAKILVAEDDPSVRLTLEFVLSDEGFEVLLAADGQEALEMARELRPDAILLDQIMPKLNGKEVLSALRSDSATSAIPVFVLTGMTPADPSEWADAKFIGKPFTPDVLVDHIRRALGG
jgi:CheY-like chemotaxis protein